MVCRSLLVVVAALSVSFPVFAADTPDADSPAFELTLQNHAFVPAQLTVPVGKTIKLTVKNLDATAAEFESDDFQTEKIIPANGETMFYIGPFKAGNYGFYDDFHEDDTKGTLVAQ